MKLKNHIAELIMITLFLTVFLSSCSMGKLTTNQQAEILKIDKQIDKLYIEYSYKVDSLYIKRDSVIKNKEKVKECCIKTSQEVYEYEGLTIDSNN